MVDIVAIHGIKAEQSSRGEMLEAWRAAMVAGLENVRSERASRLTVEFGFYGHEYNDGKAIDEPVYTRVDLEAGFESELVTAIGDALVESGDADDDTKLYLPGSLQRALVAIERSELFGGRVSRLVSFVKQVRRYLDDDDLRQRVHNEIDAAMAQSPKVVIGHSLGSVVAYDWLQRNRSSPEPALLTIGSPLGLKTIRDRLDQPADRSRWPGEVRSWTNIAAHHDAVAMVKELGPLYHPDIKDLPCENPRSAAHSAEQYLRNVRVSRVLKAELG